MVRVVRRRKPAKPKTTKNYPTVSYKERFYDLMEGFNNFTKEHRPFHGEREFACDFADIDLKIAVEYEGGVHSNGAKSHRGKAMYLKDIVKYNMLAVDGWILLRYTAVNMTNAVKRLNVKKEISKAIEGRVSEDDRK